MNAPSLELTILMPCLNEALTLPVCIRKAKAFLETHGIRGEVLIADNGSTDGSQEISRAEGARVVPVPIRGYGAALLAGIEAAHGKYVIFGDADDSYDFTSIMPFVTQLRNGAEIVMGNRFQGGIGPGAMPFLHRYLGNPVLSFIGRLFFRVPIGDFHCGLRGCNREAILKVGLQTTGMEFASEMIVRSALAGLRFVEVPTTLAKDGRDRPPHLRTWRDGWRHLRFLLTFSPKWLFWYPGLTLTVLGAGAMLAIAARPIQIGSAVLDVHTMLFAAALALAGVQSVLFSVLARTYAVNTGLLPSDPQLTRWWRRITLETGLAVSCACLLLGFVLGGIAFQKWMSVGYGQLDTTVTMRLVVPSVWFLLVGVQGVFSSFFLSLLGLRTSLLQSKTG